MKKISMLFHFCLEKEKYRRILNNHKTIIPLSNFKIYFYPKFLDSQRMYRSIYNRNYVQREIFNF